MNLNLTWLDKFRKIAELDPNASLKLNRVGDWYVSTNLHMLKDDGILGSLSPDSSRKTPEDSVNTFWSLSVDKLPTSAKLVLGLSDKVGYRWEGSRWTKV